MLNREHWGEIWSGLPIRKVRCRRLGLPGSWRTLMIIVRALRPRSDRSRGLGPLVNATGVVPAYVHNEDSLRLSLSGLNHTTFDLAVYASQGKSPDPTQDSLPVAGPACPGGIGYPQGSNERFPSSRLFLLSQAFPGARSLLNGVNLSVNLDHKSDYEQEAFRCEYRSGLEI